MRELISIPTRALMVKEWKSIKSKIIPLSIGLAIFSFLTIGLLKALPYIAEYLEELLPEIDEIMVTESFFSNANSIISIIAVIFCADAIAGEREKNTLVLIQTKPIKPSSVILTKLLMRFLLISIATIIGAIVFYISSVLLVGVPDPWIFVQSLSIFLLTLFTYVSIGVLISASTKTQISAGAISAGVMFMIVIISSLLVFEGIQPYNVFQLSINLISANFSTLTILLDCLALILIGIAVTIGSILIFKKKTS